MFKLSTGPLDKTPREMTLSNPLLSCIPGPQNSCLEVQPAVPGQPTETLLRTELYNCPTCVLHTDACVPICTYTEVGKL